MLDLDEMNADLQPCLHHRRRSTRGPGSGVAARSAAGCGPRRRVPTSACHRRYDDFCRRLQPPSTRTPRIGGLFSTPTFFFFIRKFRLFYFYIFRENVIQFTEKSFLSPIFSTFKKPKNRFQGINSASLCSLAGRYDNPVPTWFLAPIDCSKIPALFPVRIRKLPPDKKFIFEFFVYTVTLNPKPESINAESCRDPRARGRASQT